MKTRHTRRGFTIIELLIVITLLVILTTVTMYFLNPLARFGDARNARRWVDLDAISNAIRLYEVDHGGKLMSDLDLMPYDVYYQIGSETSGCDIECIVPSVGLQPGCLNLSELITDGYLHSMPFDPYLSNASTRRTGYFIFRPSGATSRFALGACAEELGSDEDIEPIEIMK